MSIWGWIKSKFNRNKGKKKKKSSSNQLTNNAAHKRASAVALKETVGKSNSKLGKATKKVTTHDIKTIKAPKSSSGGGQLIKAATQHTYKSTPIQKSIQAKVIKIKAAQSAVSSSDKYTIGSSRIPTYKKNSDTWAKGGTKSGYENAAMKHHFQAGVSNAMAFGNLNKLETKITGQKVNPHKTVKQNSDIPLKDTIGKSTGNTDLKATTNKQLKKGVQQGATTIKGTHNKEIKVEDTAGWKAGNIVGQALQYGAGAPLESFVTKSVIKTATKKAIGKVAGKEIANNPVTKKVVSKAVDKGLKSVKIGGKIYKTGSKATRIGAHTAGAVAGGAPINAPYAVATAKQAVENSNGKKSFGKEFTKNFAENTAIDVITGGVMHGISSKLTKGKVLNAVNNSKTLTKDSKAKLSALSAKSAKSAEKRTSVMPVGKSSADKGIITSPTAKNAVNATSEPYKGNGSNTVKISAKTGKTAPKNSKAIAAQRKRVVSAIKSGDTKQASIEVKRLKAMTSEAPTAKTIQGTGEGTTAKDNLDRLKGNTQGVKVAEAKAEMPVAVKTETHKLTGKPISEKYKTIQDKLDRGEPITKEEYNSIDEITQAKSRSNTGEETININTPERIKMRDDKTKELYSRGSAKVDKEGKTVYTGPVKRERRADIVIGLSASGKSSAVVDPLSHAHSSRLIDSDEAKKLLPEFDEGWGAGRVHKESKEINRRLLDKATENGDNIVLPIVGHNYDKVLKQINTLKKYGYDVHIHLNDLNQWKAAGRNLRRFTNEGRFVDLDSTSFKYGNKPSEVFDRLKKEGVINEENSTKVSNDVARGERPKQLSGRETLSFDWKDNRGRGSDRGQNVGRNWEEGRGVSKETKGKGQNEIAKTDTEKALEEQGKMYGTYKNGTPKKVEGEKVSKAVDNATSENGVVQNEAVKAKINDDVLAGELEFKTKSQKEALARAERIVNENPEQAKYDFYNDKTSDATIAKGVKLYEYYSAKGETDEASKIIESVSMKLTEAGRTVSAAKMLLKATPAGRVRTAQNLANKLTDMYADRITTKSGKVELSEATIKRLEDASTEEEKSAALEAAQLEMWNQIKASFQEKFDAFRYLAMLGNPKTHIRNLTGNALFAPLRETKNIAATGLENIAVKTGMMKDADRTKALIGFGDSDKISFAMKDFDDNADVIVGKSNRWRDASGKSRPDDSQLYNTKWLEALRKGCGNLLNKEDAMFMKPAYSVAMTRYMKAQKLTPKDMTGEVLAKAQDIAREEALRATYRDYTKFGNWLTKVKEMRNSKSIPKKVIGITMESTVPFAKTPVNILRRGIDYSPVGLMTSTVKMARAAAKGDGTEVAKQIDRLAAGLTGTGIFALGAFLNSKGIITLSVGQDNKGKYDSAQGKQKFSINVAGHNITAGWAIPASIPFFFGAQFNQTKKDGSAFNTKMLDSVAGIIDPVAELSMMQGFTNTLESVRYGESLGSRASNLLTYLATNYISQAIPTVFSQVAKTIDKTSRTSKSTAEGNVAGKFESAYLRAKNKIPGLSMTSQPNVDVWGREIKQGEVGDRIFQNFISPATIKTLNTTSVDKELTKLYDKADDDKKNSILPKGASGYNLKLDGKDVRMTKAALTKYNKGKGKIAYERVKAFMQSPEYQYLSDDDKIKKIASIYTDAGSMGKQESLISMGKDKFKVRTDDWSANATKAAKKYVDKGHDIDDIVNLNNKMKAIGVKTSKDQDETIHAMFVAENAKGTKQKDLLKYFGIDKATLSKAKAFKKEGGTIGKLKDAEDYMSYASKPFKYKGKSYTPSIVKAYAIAMAGGGKALKNIYDESTPRSKQYYNDEIESGKGLVQHGITADKLKKMKDSADSSNSYGINSSEAQSYIEKHYGNASKSKKAMLWRALCSTWNAQNPYGTYVASNKSTKVSKSEFYAQVNGTKAKTPTKTVKTTKTVKVPSYAVMRNGQRINLKGLNGTQIAQLNLNAKGVKEIHYADEERTAYTKAKIKAKQATKSGKEKTVASSGGSSSGYSRHYYRHSSGRSGGSSSGGSTKKITIKPAQEAIYTAKKLSTKKLTAAQIKKQVKDMTSTKRYS